MPKIPKISKSCNRCKILENRLMHAINRAEGAELWQLRASRGEHYAKCDIATEVNKYLEQRRINYSLKQRIKILEEENERLKEKCGETDETNEDEEEEMDDEEEEEETVEEEEEMETSENKEDKDENAGNNNKNEEIQQINKDEQIKEKEETIKEQKQNEEIKEINKDEQVKEKEETTKAPSNQAEKRKRKAASRAVKKRRRKGKETERENLRNQLLTANTQQKRKQILEEKLCPLVSRYFRGKDAGKITGMILENENSEILKALENDELLRAKVSATVEMFQASRVAQQH